MGLVVGTDDEAGIKEVVGLLATVGCEIETEEDTKGMVVAGVSGFEEALSIPLID